VKTGGEDGSATFRHQWGSATNEADISVHGTFSSREPKFGTPAGSIGAKIQDLVKPFFRLLSENNEPSGNPSQAAGE
ncbi:MAG: hypothetical protein WCB44_33385, partial [Stellaceae bacterium]